MQKYNTIKNIHNLNIKKLAIIIIAIFLFTYIKIIFGKIRIENKVIRFIKRKRNKKLYFYNFEKELPSIKNYVKSLKEGKFKNIIYYSNINKIKVSFIASVYNKESYLKAFILSIQKQDLKEYELILVDDCSSDKSIEIISIFKKNDNRIKLIKIKNNSGTLYARYIGALYAKGEYIIFVDTDDIVLKSGIMKTYNHIKKKNLDMVEFHSVFEINNLTTYISRRYYSYSTIIYQPILSYIFYYKDNEGIELNTALWDKLVKRKIVLKSFNYIGEKFLNEKIIIENDVIILFSLFRNANSFHYINEIGYYYFLKNNDSITNTRYEPVKANQIIYSIFCNIKFLYEKTGDSFFDKYFAIYKLEQGYERYKICLKYLNNEYKLIMNVLNKFINSKYISLQKKLTIKTIKNEIFKKNLNFIF
jgi:glycosyltransferase involved in cell wall biosynthesis